MSRLIINNRQVGGTPYLVGSRPPSYDSLWKYVEKEGFEVETFDRNCQNHEKEVDSKIACAITQASDNNDPNRTIIQQGPVVIAHTYNPWPLANITYYPASQARYLPNKDAYFQVNSSYRRRFIIKFPI